MLSYDANERITIEEIMNHEWFTSGPTATQEELRESINLL